MFVFVYSFLVQCKNTFCEVAISGAEGGSVSSEQRRLIVGYPTINPYIIQPLIIELIESLLIENSTLFLIWY